MTTEKEIWDFVRNLKASLTKDEKDSMGLVIVGYPPVVGEYSKIVHGLSSGFYMFSSINSNTNRVQFRIDKTYKYQYGLEPEACYNLSDLFFYGKERDPMVNGHTLGRIPKDQEINYLSKELIPFIREYKMCVLLER